MSFIREYHRLFKIKVRDHVTHKELSSFKVVPTAECRKQLEKHQLVFQERKAGGEVFYQLNPEASDPVMGKISKRVVFGFVLKLLEAEFFEDYLPSLSSEAGPQMYFDNLNDGDGSIQPVTATQLTVNPTVGPDDGAKFYGKIFHININKTNAPLSLTIKDSFSGEIVPTLNGGEMVPAINIPTGAEGEVASIKIDLSVSENGKYHLTTEGSEISQKNIYVDDDLKRLNPIGFLNIYLNQPQNEMPEGGAEFLINFQHR